MAEVIGIVGLAIAVFDQFLKLGDKTIETIQCVRTFAEDLKDASETIRREQGIAKALNYLLFEKSPKYGGQMLFEQYDEEAQRFILSVVGELVDALESAAKLLDTSPPSPLPAADLQRSGLSSHAGTLSSSITLTEDKTNRAGLTFFERTSSSASLRRKLRWSFYDKKRAKDIIDRYAKLNGHLYRVVQLNSFASGIGVDLQHLENMKQSRAAQELGFDETASLQLLAREAALGMAANFEVSDGWMSTIEDGRQVEGRFVTFVNEGRPYLQDTCEYKLPSISDGIDNQTRSRLNGLAALLQQPKEQIFRIPKCIGWKYLPSTKDIAFIFESPGNPHASQPQSLLHLLSMPEFKPTLQAKFQLAYSLAKSISQLQMVQWLHESLRSENILFFPPPQGGSPDTVALSEPWVFGFDFSRPENFFSYGFADSEPERDIYRHPERQGNPTAMFSKWHDIYSLGVMLLEIGIWEPAIQQEHPRDQFKNMKTPEDRKNRLVKVARKRLPPKMGGKYSDLVVRCLTGNFDVGDDTKGDIKLQQAFRSQVIEALGRVLESI
ncbi:hypothetical protein B0H67DRAFT_572424 [Lasiosphaeris hirsuta]|uniref:DUF7580 domain-containing protein n=1 Tax=Lasiosphaeris hirsuta TaxID=260670 RepID=A0AA40E8B5_9PEZI|nr:hypothetical protein B0H67DRAFT_572424 [Lasiosphaeris hirsuta]